MTESNAQPEVNDSGNHSVKNSGGGGMPSREVMVREALEMMVSKRSQLLRDVDRTTLGDLCMRLVDIQTPISAAHQWLNAELGGTSNDEVIDDNAVYRFANNFRPIYFQVRAGYVRRMVRLNVEHATDGRIRDVHQLAKARLIDLVTEKLVDMDDLEQVRTDQLSAMISTIEGFSRGQMKEAELELKREQAEQRAHKLEAEVEKLRLENDKRKRDLQTAIEQAKKDVQTAPGSVGETGNKVVDANAVIAILDRVMKGEA